MNCTSIWLRHVAVGLIFVCSGHVHAHNVPNLVIFGLEGWPRFSGNGRYTGTLTAALDTQNGTRYTAILASCMRNDATRMLDNRFLLLDVCANAPQRQVQWTRLDDWSAWDSYAALSFRLGMELCSFDGSGSAEAIGLWNRLHLFGGESDSAVIFAGIDWHGMLAAGAFRMGCSLAARKETNPDSNLQSQHLRIVRMVLQGTTASYWNFRVFESARVEAQATSPTDAWPKAAASWSSFQFERPHSVGDNSNKTNARFETGHPLDIGMLEGCAAVAASRTIALSSKDRAVLKVLGARCWAWMQRTRLVQDAVVQPDGTRPSQPSMVSTGPDGASPLLQPTSRAMMKPARDSAGSGLSEQISSANGGSESRAADISIHSCYWLWDGTAGFGAATETAGARACRDVSSDSTLGASDSETHKYAPCTLGAPDGPPRMLSPAQQACLAATVLAAGNKLALVQPHDIETGQLVHVMLQNNRGVKRATTGIDVLLPPLRPDIYYLVAGSHLEIESASSSAGRGQREKIVKSDDSIARAVQTRSYLLHCARIVPIKRPWLFVEAVIRAKQELRAAGIEPALCAPGYSVESRKSQFNESEASQQPGPAGEVPTAPNDFAGTKLCVEHRHSGGHDSLRDCLVGDLLAHFPTAHIITEFLDARGLASLLRKSVAYVHAAAQEPYGMALVEAAAFGAVPIVSTSAAAAVTNAQRQDCDDAHQSGSESESSQACSQQASVTGCSIGARVGKEFAWGDLVVDGVQRNQIDRVGLDTPHIGATELVRPRCGESIGVAIGSDVPESTAVARLAETFVHKVLADSAALSAGGRQAEGTTGGMDSYRSRGLSRATAWSVEEHAAGLISLLELAARVP